MPDNAGWVALRLTGLSRSSESDASSLKRVAPRWTRVSADGKRWMLVGASTLSIASKGAGRHGSGPMEGVIVDPFSESCKTLRNWNFAARSSTEIARKAATSLTFRGQGSDAAAVAVAQASMVGARNE